MYPFTPMPNERILVVDDEETIREIVSSMLGGAHFRLARRQAAWKRWQF